MIERSFVPAKNSFARAHVATPRSLLLQNTTSHMQLYEKRILRIFPEKLCILLIISNHNPVDIVEVVDSSSTTPTIFVSCQAAGNEQVSGGFHFSGFPLIPSV